MAATSRVPAIYSTNTSNRGPSGLTTTTSRANTTRPRTSGRPKSAASALTGVRDQTIICAISESRGISPTVGLAFVNVTTYEAVLCQICDSQTYVKTIHKLAVYSPTEILFMNTATNPPSKLFAIVEDNIQESKLIPIDRKYWAENTGLEYVHQLAFKADLESLKVTLGGNYFATCCFAAVGQSYISSVLL
jgi:DNA mismatch repair protein MSH4